MDRVNLRTPIQGSPGGVSLRKPIMAGEHHTPLKTKLNQKGEAKVGKVMHEYKAGTLRSGSGGKVKSRAQAVAIGMSEGRKAMKKKGY